jgi:hypothetical protein
MDLFWTPKENIALELILELLGESRVNRTTAEYLNIAAHLPKVEVAYEYVNRRLGELKMAGFAPYEICYFRSGDRGHWYQPFPQSLSQETVRKAIRKYRRQAALAKMLLSY